MKFYVQTVRCVLAATEDAASRQVARGEGQTLSEAVYNERDHAEHFAALEDNYHQTGEIFLEWRRPMTRPSALVLQQLQAALPLLEPEAQSWVSQMIADQSPPKKAFERNRVEVSDPELWFPQAVNVVRRALAREPALLVELAALLREADSP